MEESRQDQLIKNQQATSVCSELNLDLARLEDETLMVNPIYRRLFNIVKNDMARGQLMFRKNLIRELYFLLQVTPIIREELKEKFLHQVQKMYNLNDHKKIEITSSKLNNLLNIMGTKKDSSQSGQSRPKSGLAWNQDVIPFLRPYTATRKRQVKSIRPDSSKFNSQSTKVQTIEETCIREFTTNIQEELEISQDFVQKHRTNHPQYEPVYQQLYNILKKIQNKHPDDSIIEEVKPKGPRYPKSALTRHKEQSWVRPETNPQSEQCIAEPKAQLDEQNLREEGKSQAESSQEEEYLYVNEMKKPYKPYSKSIKVQETTPESKKVDITLDKYSHLLNMRMVQAVRQDHEMAKKCVNYARIKTTMKKEQNRRNESRRLMSAKSTTKSAVKFTRISQDEKQNLQECKHLLVDLRKDPKVIAAEPINSYPTYNKRYTLKQTYQRPISAFVKRNNIGFTRSPDFKPQPLKRPLTSYTRFNSPQVFDPMSAENVKKYNAEVLDQIQKIKMKMGGKNSASTQSLMKALAVVQPCSDDLPIKWQEKSPFYNMISIGKGKKLKRKTRKNLKSSNKLKK